MDDAIITVINKIAISLTTESSQKALHFKRMSFF